MLPAIDSPNEISGYPRFTEAARYWMQWAGIPDTIYSDSQGKNDYTDDYRSRGKWVNYLCGGSSLNPKEKGLNIPIDLAFAFHSDAGTTPNDSIVGTLGIFFTDVYDKRGAWRFMRKSRAPASPGNFGIATVLLNGKKKDIILKAVDDEERGTVFLSKSDSR